MSSHALLVTAAGLHTSMAKQGVVVAAVVVVVVEHFV